LFKRHKDRPGDHRKSELEGLGPLTSVLLLFNCIYPVLVNAAYC
jgi:hypothetical protein